MDIPQFFSDDFPNVSSKSELARVITDHPQYDSYYVATGCIPERRRLFEELWAVYHPYADSHFLQQYKSQFHARSWEMYLGVVLLQRGFSLGPAHDHGPDLHVVSPTVMWIEAVTAQAGERADAVPTPAPGVHDYPEEQILLRLANSVKVKHEQHQTYLQNQVVEPRTPYIIAVNRGGLEYPEPTIPLMVKWAFGAAHLVIPLTPEAGDRSFLRRRDSVTKTSGPVPIGFLQGDGMAGVSAVLYSSHNVLNQPEVIGDDCIVVHNLGALNPLPDELFASFEQWRLEGDLLRRIPPGA